jgi:hypothetical protein
MIGGLLSEDTRNPSGKGNTLKCVRDEILSGPKNINNNPLYLNTSVPLLHTALTKRTPKK